MRMSSPSNEAAPRLKMDDLEDLLAQHASVTMNLGLKDHSVSRRDALLGQSLAEKDRAEARDFTRRGDGVAPSEPWQCHCCAQDNVADAFKCRCCGRPASYGRPDASRPQPTWPQPVHTQSPSVEPHSSQAHFEGSESRDEAGGAMLSEERSHSQAMASEV